MKKEQAVWEIVIETVTAIAVLAFFGCQAYYAYAYKSGAAAMLYRVLPPLLLYAGATVLQVYPELLNGGGERLQGKVRIYAVRMVRTCKMLLMLGILLPSAADAAGIGMSAGYSLLVLAGILATAAYYLYRVYQYNSKKKK